MSTFKTIDINNIHREFKAREVVSVDLQKDRVFNRNIYEIKFKDGSTVQVKEKSQQDLWNKIDKARNSE